MTASAAEHSEEWWLLPKSNSCHPCSPLASGGGGSRGLDSSPSCVPPLPMAGHSSNQPLIPGEAEFNWATLLEALDPVLGNPHSSTVLGRGNQLLSPPELRAAKKLPSIQVSSGFSAWSSFA